MQDVYIITEISSCGSIEILGTATTKVVAMEMVECYANYCVYNYKTTIKYQTAWCITLENETNITYTHANLFNARSIEKFKRMLAR